MKFIRNAFRLNQSLESAPRTRASRGARSAGNSGIRGSAERVSRCQISHLAPKRALGDHFHREPAGYVAVIGRVWASADVLTLVPKDASSRCHLRAPTYQSCVFLK